MEHNAQPSHAADSKDLAGRDRAIFRMMGGFFSAFALLTLVGLFWKQTSAERVVNIAASLILLGVGLGAFRLAARVRRRDR
jgi:uncharacterized membrane protein YeiB